VAGCEADREGQITDRYTKAIEQLGSSTIDVTIGGIYALERIARDSPRDHPTVMEVLTAFVREHSRERWPSSATNESGTETPARTTRPDVQAAITVIGRRDTRSDRRETRGDRRRQPIDLTGANLTRANLSDADLSAARLTGADLTGANLDDAKLTSAHLNGAHLNGAHLDDADLDDADHTGAHLTGALLSSDAVVPEGWQLDDSRRLKPTGTNSGGATTN